MPNASRACGSILEERVSDAVRAGRPCAGFPQECETRRAEGRPVGTLREAPLSFALEQCRGDLLGGQHRPVLRLLAEVFRPFADACVRRLERA